jgi:serine/threonine-protein kinase
MVESAPQSGCPGEGTLLDHAHGRLEPARRAVVEAHLSRCEECRKFVMHLGSDCGGTPPFNDSIAFGVTLPSLQPGPLPASGPPPAGTRAVVRVGEVIDGKYEIERILGQGAMGVVAQAHHRGLARRVAMKFLSEPLSADAAARARFLREARAMAQLEGAHVVRVLDVTDGPTPYLVMELLHGRDLGAHLREHGALPVAEAVEFVLQACEALAEAHARGVVHRDLKPTNLFVVDRADGAPFVKVLDFGIAKAAATDGDAGHELTRSGTLLGSPRYMSPEQVQSPRDVDARTDVWSLGAVLWELCAGRPAFDAPSLADLFARIVGEPAPRLDRVRPEVPEAVALAVAGCLVRDRTHRTPSVAAFAEALAPAAPRRAYPTLQRIRALANRTATPHRAGPPRTLAIIVAASITSAVVGATTATLAFRRGERAAAELPTATAAAPPTATAPQPPTATLPEAPTAAAPEPPTAGAPPRASATAPAALRGTASAPSASAVRAEPPAPTTGVVPLVQKGDAFRDRM